MRILPGLVFASTDDWAGELFSDSDNTDVLNLFSRELGRGDVMSPLARLWMSRCGN